MRHRVFKRGKHFYADYTDMRTGRRVWKALGATSKAQANQILAKIMTETVERGYFEDRREPQVRLADFAEDYLAWAKANKKSFKNDMIFVRRFVQEWGDKLLSEITPHMIEQYKAHRCQEMRKNSLRRPVPVTQNHVNHELSVLRGLFNKAIAWGKVQTTPMKSVKFFKVDDRRMVYLDREQVQALLAACEDKRTPYLRPVVEIALNTGMRRGEILNLRWQDVDYKANVIRIRQSKSGEQRGVPMNEAVKGALRECVAVERLAGATPQSPYVFCDREGRPYREIKNGFNSAKRRAGLLWLHFHDLRHTFSSHLISSGENLTVIRELLGHKSYAMTLRYAHLSKDRKVQAVERLGALYGSPQEAGEPSQGEQVGADGKGAGAGDGDRV